MGKIIQLYLCSTDHIFVFDSSIYAGSCSTSILECSVFCGCVDLWCCAYPSGLAQVGVMVLCQYKHSWFATDANPGTSMQCQLYDTVASSNNMFNCSGSVFMQLERYILQVYHEAMNSIYLALDFLFPCSSKLVSSKIVAPSF